MITQSTYYEYQAGTPTESVHIICWIDNVFKAQIRISPRLDKVTYSECLYFKRFHPKEQLSMATLYVELATLYRDVGIKDLREIAKLAVEGLNHDYTTETYQTDN